MYYLNHATWRRSVPRRPGCVGWLRRRPRTGGRVKACGRPVPELDEPRTFRAAGSVCSNNRGDKDKRQKSIFWAIFLYVLDARAWDHGDLNEPDLAGSKAIWVLGNQPIAGFARRFGLLARQHMRWRARDVEYEFGGPPNTNLGACISPF